MRKDLRLNSNWYDEDETSYIVMYDKQSENNYAEFDGNFTLNNYIDRFFVRNSSIEDIEINMKNEENEDKDLDVWSYCEKVYRDTQFIHITNHFYSYCIQNADDYTMLLNQYMKIPYGALKSVLFQTYERIEDIIEFAKYIMNQQLDIPNIEKNKIICFFTLRLMEVAQKLYFNFGQYTKSPFCKKQLTLDDWRTEWTNNLTEFIQLILSYDKLNEYVVIQSFFQSCWISSDKETAKSVFRECLLEAMSADECLLLLDKLKFCTTSASMLSRMILMICMSESRNQLGIPYTDESCMLDFLAEIDDIRCNVSKIRYLNKNNIDDMNFAWLTAYNFVCVDVTEKTIDTYFQKYNRRLDGWCYSYEKSSKLLEMQFYYVIIGAFMVDWLSRLKKEKSIIDIYEWVWEKLIYCIKNCTYQYGKLFESTLQIISERFILIVDPEKELDDFGQQMIEELLKIHDFSLKIEILYGIICSKKMDGTQIKFTKDFANKVLNNIIQEKGYLDDFECQTCYKVEIRKMNLIQKRLFEFMK